MYFLLFFVIFIKKYMSFFDKKLTKISMFIFRNLLFLKIKKSIKIVKIKHLKKSLRKPY